MNPRCELQVDPAIPACMTVCVSAIVGKGLLGNLIGEAAGGAIMGAMSSAVDSGNPISGAMLGGVSGMLSSVREYCFLFRREMEGYERGGGVHLKPLMGISPILRRMKCPLPCPNNLTPSSSFAPYVPCRSLTGCRAKSVAWGALS